MISTDGIEAFIQGMNMSKMNIPINTLVVIVMATITKDYNKHLCKVFIAKLNVK